MIDGFQGLGQRLLADGFSNPFLNIPMSFMHADLDEARKAINAVGEQIKRVGLHQDLGPIVVCFTGNGNVTNGAREIFELLPHEYVKASELKSLADDIKSGKRSSNKLYAVHIRTEMVRPKAGSGLDVNAPVDRNHYFAHPEQYEPCFHETIAPYITMLVNGIYWDSRYPRLLTKDQLKTMWSNGQRKLKVVSDISCDINGSCELLTRSTTIEKPFFTYYPDSAEESDDIDNKGILVCGVDILPSELPRDASHHFSKALVELIPPVLSSNGATEADPLADLPAE
jgi:alpha-aminoadipic semialdehyde synthase